MVLFAKAGLCGPRVVGGSKYEWFFDIFQLTKMNLIEHRDLGTWDE